MRMRCGLIRSRLILVFFVRGGFGGVMLLRGLGIDVRLKLAFWNCFCGC